MGEAKQPSGLSGRVRSLSSRGHAVAGAVDELRGAGGTECEHELCLLGVLAMWLRPVRREDRKLERGAAEGFAAESKMNRGDVIKFALSAPAAAAQTRGE